jgi:HlyD family secretion protein
LSRTGRTILILVALLVAAALLVSLSARGRRATEVRVVAVHRGSLEERSTGSGRLEGLSRVKISASAMGVVDSVAVEEGDRVARGQLLLRLDSGNAEAALRQAMATAASARVGLGQAERALERVESLHRGDLASTEEYLTASESVERARSDLQRARAAVDMAEDDLEKTVYRSPVDGTVTSVNVEEGETAVIGTMNNPGTVLLTIEDVSGLLVRVSMVETEVVDVEPGMHAEVILDALPDTVFSGRVLDVGMSPISELGLTANVAEYEVKVELSGTDPRLRPGMSASVDVITATAEECLQVPIQSVVPRPSAGDSTREMDVVLRITGGVVEEVPVRTGVVGSMDVEVEGLAEGDSVVAGPLDALRDLSGGDRIEAREDGRSSR